MRELVVPAASAQKVRGRLVSIVIVGIVVGLIFFLSSNWMTIEAANSTIANATRGRVQNPSQAGGPWDLRIATK
jgi:hypothetical protein